MAQILPYTAAAPPEKTAVKAASAALNLPSTTAQARLTEFWVALDALRVASKRPAAIHKRVAELQGAAKAEFGEKKGVVHEPVHSLSGADAAFKPKIKATAKLEFRSETDTKPQLETTTVPAVNRVPAACEAPEPVEIGELQLQPIEAIQATESNANLEDAANPAAATAEQGCKPKAELELEPEIKPKAGSKAEPEANPSAAVAEPAAEAAAKPEANGKLVTPLVTHKTKAKAKTGKTDKSSKTGKADKSSKSDKTRKAGKANLKAEVKAPAPVPAPAPMLAPKVEVNPNGKAARAQPAELAQTQAAQAALSLVEAAQPIPQPPVLCQTRWRKGFKEEYCIHCGRIPSFLPVWSRVCLQPQKKRL